MILRFDLGKTTIGFMLATMTILLLVIAYRRLLTYLRKGNIDTTKYCVLYRIEKNPAEGELEFYFTNEETKQIAFELLNNQFEVIETLASQDFEKGSHILRYDSAKLKNGTYYYQLRTDNQKTYKKLEILN